MFFIGHSPILGLLALRGMGIGNNHNAFIGGTEPLLVSYLGGGGGGGGGGGLIVCINNNSLISHTFQSPRERGSDNFVYIKLYMLQDAGVTNHITAFQCYHSHVHVQ